MDHGPVTAGPAAPPRSSHRGGAARLDPWSTPVLDLVLVLAVLALFALVGAVAAGVGRL